MGKLIRTRSQRLFPKANDRLTILAGIGNMPPSEPVIVRELVRRLDLPQPKVSRELGVLHNLGLLLSLDEDSAGQFHRLDTTFWSGCSDLFDIWHALEASDDNRG